MKTKNCRYACWLTAIVFMVGVNGLQGQETTAPTNKWSFILEPYLMFPNMQGTTGIGALPDAEVDENPGDVFENLQIGAMLYGEAYKGAWAISSDFTYMSLGSDIVGKNQVLSGDADIKQLAWELAGLRKVKPWLEVGIGLQLNNIKADVNLVATTPGGSVARSSGLNETWVDPSLIARIKLPLATKWSFQFRGNIGGFGIGSDFYWQIQSYVGYRLSKLLELSAGYRVISVDYEKGSGSDRFLYDMNTFGPVLRFGFHL